MVKGAKEIQIEGPREVETQSTGAMCSPSEEQAKKPSMLCFKKRRKSCKKDLTVKDACEGVSEEKSQHISTDQGEVEASNRSRSSKGAWTAIKNLTRPRRRQKPSSQKKVPSDSQVQLETDAEEGCTQSFPKKRVSSGVKMPCVRFSRGKRKSSPSEVVEESEGSVKANEVMGISNKASEEPEDLVPTDKHESFSPVSAEQDRDAAKESHSSAGKSEPVSEPSKPMSEPSEPVSEPSEPMTEPCEPVSEPSEPVSEPCGPMTEPCGPVSEPSEPVSEPSEPVTEPCGPVTEPMTEPCEPMTEPCEPVTELTTGSPPAEEPTECTAQSEITDSETVNEIALDKLQDESQLQATIHEEGGEFAPEVPVSKDQPNSTPETTELQEIPNVCKEVPEGDEPEKSINLPEECKAEEIVEDFSQSALKEDTASTQSCSSHQVMLEANMGAGVSIVITVTEAEDSDNTDSDQAYEPSPVLQRNKQKGNKNQSENFDSDSKEVPKAGDNPQVEEKSLGDQGHRAGEQYELLLIETASSLVKAAIQSSIEQLVSEMALEQNKHNSLL